MTSTTPVATASSALSLTERRKAETRMEIARAAAGLFVRQGLRATRAEDIARAAGIAPRTFYRYFAVKEEAVAPLYAAGAERWAAAVRAAPEELSVPEALEQAVRHTLTPDDGVSSASWMFARTLIRLARSDPALRKVWAEVCHASEQRLLEVLADRLGPVVDTARSSAEAPARSSAEDRAPQPQPRTQLQLQPQTSASVPGTSASVPGDFDNVAAVSPELRFAAVVASAAVRVAVETWAVGDDPAEGPDGPVELALRNLSVLRDFPWEAVTESRG